MAKRQPKLRAWNWTDPFYRVGVMLFVGDFVRTRETIRKVINEAAADGFHTDRSPIARTTWIDSKDGCGVVIWLEKFNPKDGDLLGTLVHEIHHATFFTLTARGLTHSESSEEAYAYHKAWLFRQCFARLVGKTREGRFV